MKTSRHVLIAAAFAFAAPFPAAAERPMTAAEFESYVTGKTLHYGNLGSIYGIEQYLPKRRVYWAYLEDECQEGVWYPEGDQICFVYDYDPTPQCWTFWKRASGLVARFQNDPEGTYLYEVKQSKEPLRCLGPKVGA